MTAREKFRLGDIVVSSPTDPRGPRSGMVVGFALHPGDIEVAVDAFDEFGEPAERVTMTHMDWWEIGESPPHEPTLERRIHDADA